MGFELTAEEIALVVSRLKTAKFNGFGGVICKFTDHRMVTLKMELDEPKDNLLRLYPKISLTEGTSGVRFSA
jgi:hypothetical protein